MGVGGSTFICMPAFIYVRLCVFAPFTSGCQREDAVYSLRGTSKLFGAAVCLALVKKEEERREESESKRRRRLYKVEICTRKRKSMQNSC